MTATKCVQKVCRNEEEGATANSWQLPLAIAKSRNGHMLAPVVRQLLTVLHTFAHIYLRPADDSFICLTQAQALGYVTWEPRHMCPAHVAT